VSVPGYPLLTEVGAFSQLAHSYSVADVADIVQYALERGIRWVHASCSVHAEALRPRSRAASEEPNSFDRGARGGCYQGAGLGVALGAANVAAGGMQALHL